MLGNWSRSPVLEQRATGTITAGPYPVAAADPAGPPDKEQSLSKHCGVHAQRGRARVSTIIVHNWAFSFRQAASPSELGLESGALLRGSLGYVDG